MKRKALIVYNPYSGGGKHSKVLKKLLPALDRAVISYQTQETLASYSESVASISNALDETITDIIAIGGDGTIHHVLNGIKDKQVVLNIIPAGTGNDFVKNISIGKKLKEHILTVIHGNVRSVDVGQCNDRLFANVLGLGFDGQIVSDMLHKKTFLKGHTKYYYFVLKILATFKSVLLNYSVDNVSEKKDTLLLTIANGTTVGGGFKLAPNADISDGLLDVCRVGRVSPMARFLNIHKLSNGTHNTLKDVSFDTATSVFVEETSQISAHIDGEYFGHPPFDIQVLSGALSLRVAADYGQLK